MFSSFLKGAVVMMALTAIKTLRPGRMGPMSEMDGALSLFL